MLLFELKAKAWMHYENCIPDCQYVHESFFIFTPGLEVQQQRKNYAAQKHFNNRAKFKKSFKTAARMTTT